MSIKLYYAFRIKKPLIEVLPILRTYSDKLELHMNQRLKTAMCKKVWTLTVNSAVREMGTEAIEKLMYPYTMSPQTKKYMQGHMYEKPFWWGEELVRRCASHSEFTTIRHEVDHDCYCEFNVVLFPYEEHTIGLPYGEESFFEDFLKQPEVEDFSYWNNVDPLESVSEEEWAERAAAWEAVLPTGIPAKDGFSYQILSAESIIFPSINDKLMEAFIQENRTGTLDYLVKEAIRTAIMKEMESDDRVSVILEANDLAVHELRKGSDRGNQLRRKYEDLLPHTWSECSELLFSKAPAHQVES